MVNREQLIIDKVTEIQKENRILLKKMLTIDLKPSKHNPQKIKMFPTPSSYSLNRQQRIRELTRVTQENKMLLQRLQTAQSVYDREKWEQDFKKKNYHQGMLRKNADRFCQHPYFVMSSEPRVMSATGTNHFGNSTMPLKGKRARSNYSLANRGKKRKKRLFTAGHGGRKRSAVQGFSRTNRPITAKGPGLGSQQRQTKTRATSNNENLRPDTVPFTNIGPLGDTEPADENDKIKQEITREVTGESEKEIEARIGNEEVKEESESDSKPPLENKFNEQEKLMEDFTDGVSDNQEKHEVDKESSEKSQNQNNSKHNTSNSNKNHEENHADEQPNTGEAPVLDSENNDSPVNKKIITDKEAKESESEKEGEPLVKKDKQSRSSSSNQQD